MIAVHERYISLLLIVWYHFTAGIKMQTTVNAQYVSTVCNFKPLRHWKVLSMQQKLSDHGTYLETVVF